MHDRGTTESTEKDQALTLLRGAFLLILFLICGSLYLTLIHGSRAAQSACDPSCSAVVPPTGLINVSLPFRAMTAAMSCAGAVSYAWSFGDDSPGSSLQNPTHTYQATGTYMWGLMTKITGEILRISTVAGGYGEGAGAKQAPLTTPVAITRDPLGGGVYLADATFSFNLIRYVNTGEAPVTRAGKVVTPGTISALAGGGLNTGDDVLAAEADLGSVTGLAAGADGKLLFFIDAAGVLVRALNVSPATVIVGGKSIEPGHVRTLANQTAGLGSELTGLALDPASGDLLIADASFGDNQIFRLTLGGELSVVAGNAAPTVADDPLPPPPVSATSVPLLQPRAIETDRAGTLYIADSGHARIVKVDREGKIFLVAQYSTRRDNPFLSGLAFLNEQLYAAFGSRQTIVRVTGGTSVVAGQDRITCDYSTSNCGDRGPGTEAGFNFPGASLDSPLVGLEGDSNGLYILDQGYLQKGRMRYLNLSQETVTLAGVSVAPSQVDTIAGSGLPSPYDNGSTLGALLRSPGGLAVDEQSNLLLCDSLAGRLRFVNRGPTRFTVFEGTPAARVVPPGSIITLNDNGAGSMGDGVPVRQATFDTPQGLTLTPQGIFIADANRGPTVPPGPLGRRTGLVRFINTTPAAVTFFSSSASPVTAPSGQVITIAGSFNPEGDSAPGDGGHALNARFFGPSDVAVSPITGDIFVADVGNRLVRRINRNTGIITSLNIVRAQYTGLDFDATGRLYIVNPDSNLILRETAPGSNTFRPIDLPPNVLNQPRDVTVDGSSNAYVTNSGDHKILRISAAGLVGTIAGTTPGFSGDGEAAVTARLRIAPPGLPLNAVTTVPRNVGIALNKNGEIFFADSGNHRIRRVSNVSECLRGGTITISETNPAPTLMSLNPSVALVGGASFTLTANGANFTSSSILRVNGNDRATTFASGTQLRAEIRADDLRETGTLKITVHTPAPGGGTTDALGLKVTTPNPIPTILSLDPEYGLLGGPALTLKVKGTNFIDGAVVRWNGRDRPTTFVKLTELAAAIPASDLVTAGTATITVFNSAPGGGLSNQVGFPISLPNPTPTLTGVIPETAFAGGPAFTLTVDGTDFLPASVVRWNGNNRPTTFISATRLTAIIPGNDLAAASTATVVVFNPPPGGGASNQASFAIITANPVPAITELKPSSARVGGPALTLAVNGFGFVRGSVVRWNGSERPTTYISSQEVTAAIPASDLVTLGPANVAVINPGPGGGLSNQLSFSVITTPAPLLASASPSYIIAGGSAFTLTVNGTNFVNESAVRWNGIDRGTTFVSNTQLIAAIPASDIAQAGTVKLTVFSPAPGGGLSNSLDFAVVNPVVGVSAASFLGRELAAESIVALYGVNLATATLTGTTFPLPTSLGGTVVRVKDSAGIERLAALFFVSPSQLNLQLPPGSASGPATVTVTSGDGAVSSGQMQISATAPGLFAANANGKDVAAAVVVRVAADDSQTTEPVARFDETNKRFVPLPVDLGPEADRLFLILFGTGLRARSTLSAVITRIGGVEVPALFAGPTPGLVGLDQVNLSLPRSLRGRGEVNIELLVDGKMANVVKVSFK